MHCGQARPFTQENTPPLWIACVTSLPLMCVSVALLVKEERLWRAQLPSMGVKTFQHTGKEAARIFFCYCCIMAGRNREVLLLALRCLTLISQLILQMLQSHQTQLQQRGTEGGFLSVVQHILLARDVRQLTCVHIFYACGIHSEPQTHTALVSADPNSMLLHAKFNTAQGKAVFVFALSLLPHAEDTNHKKQGETHRAGLLIDFIEWAWNKWLHYSAKGGSSSYFYVSWLLCITGTPVDPGSM